MWIPDREFPGDSTAVQDADPRMAVNQEGSEPPKNEDAHAGCHSYAEMLKAWGCGALLWLQTLLCTIWNTGIIPTDWRRGVVVSIWKGIFDTQKCSSYRGVTLLSMPGICLGMNSPRQGPPTSANSPAP